MEKFAKVVDEHNSLFESDGTAFLVHRLRHNVIKAGLRLTNLAYSTISFVSIIANHIANIEQMERVIRK